MLTWHMLTRLYALSNACASPLAKDSGALGKDEVLGGEISDAL